MATSQPLVCASLHLPPDLQPFLRIYEVSWHVFSPNLDRLRSVVDETWGGKPEAAKIFYETRMVINEELIKVFKPLQFGKEVARRYSKVLDAVEEKKPTREALYDVGLSAEMGMRVSKEAQQALSVFRKELEKAIDRVTTATDAKSKKGSKSLLTSSQNIQLVSEIFSAIVECNGLLQQCHDQFAQLLKQALNENSIDSNPPSEEEARVMRAKWKTFFDTIEDAWKQSFTIADGVLFASSDGPKNASGSRKPKQSVPLWRALFQREDKRDLVRPGNILEIPRESTDPGTATVTPDSPHEITTNVINTVDATQRLQAPEDTAVSDTTPSNDPAADESKASFSRKVFRNTSSSSPRDVSGRPRDNATPDTSVPPPKVPFWRKLFGHVSCVSKTPFR